MSTAIEVFSISGDNAGPDSPIGMAVCPESAKSDNEEPALQRKESGEPSKQDTPRKLQVVQQSDASGLPPVVAGENEIQFILKLSDEEASLYLQDVISQSIAAVFAQVFETFHKWAQYFRR